MSIKFRVFDLVTKQMYFYESVRNKPIKYLESNNLKVMQFTGLYDKNGNEIYEGDFLQRKFNTKTQIFTGKEVNSPGYAISKVVFNKGGYKGIIVKQENYYYGELPSEPNDIFRPEEYLEIIGNIYD